MSDAGEQVVAAMAAGGVEWLFFTSGSELAFYQEAIAKARALGRKAPRLVLFTHEYPALNAALGYAAATGKPAATAAHVDVGTQHYGAAIHSAMRSGLPVLITAGAPPVGMPGTRRGARDAGHFWVQDLPDQNGIVRQYMKWEHRLEFQDNPGLVVSRALQVACTPPCGPVYLSLPREVALAPLPEEAAFPSAAQLGIALPPAPDPAAIADLAVRLAAAKNPAIVVSGSGRDPASVPLLVELCEALAMPVVDSSSRSYHCFPMDHPLYQAGMSLSECDVVVALDAEVPWMPGPRAPSRDAFVAVIDVDPAKLKIPTYEFEASVRITGDATIALKILISEVKKFPGRKNTERLQRLTAASKARVEKARQEALAVSTNSPIDPVYLAYCINQLLDDNCVLVDDTLTHNPLYNTLALGGASRYFRNPGSAGGWGPGFALGVKLGMPQRDVVLATGDGFWMYSSSNAALWTACRQQAPFLSVIFQNRSYSTGTRAAAALYPDGYAVKAGLEGGYFDPPIDFAKEAEAAGAWGENVRDPAVLPAALSRGLDQVRRGKPAVVAVWLARMLQKD